MIKGPAIRLASFWIIVTVTISNGFGKAMVNTKINQTSNQILSRLLIDEHWRIDKESDWAGNHKAIVDFGFSL